MNDKGFNWTCDQWERYVVVALCIDYFFKENNITVLDVGGVSPDHIGDKLWLPMGEILNNLLGPQLQDNSAPIKFNTFVVDLIYCGESGAIQGDGCFLPFKNNTFDLVASLDTLEHIPPESREKFLGELCRVSRDLILISAPPKDENIELVEKTLLTQIKQLYGLEHQQLLEHRQLGLPASEEVVRVLSREAGPVETFAWGSVENFFFFQSIKNLFLFHPKARQMLAFFDDFIINRFWGAENQPPYSHYFWLATKRREPQALKEGVNYILVNMRNMSHPREKLSPSKALSKGPPKGQSKDSSRDSEKDQNIASPKSQSKGAPQPRNFLRDLVQINKEITKISNSESVSTIVMAKRGGEVLDRCLNCLLTQNVYFPLEIVVWDLSENFDVHYQLKSFFPQVTYVTLKKKKERKIREAFCEVACQVRGTYLLFLDEKIALPPNGVATFFEKARQAAGEKLVCPRVIDEQERTRVGFFPENLTKLPWRNLIKLMERAESQPEKGLAWVWSECVFLKRSLLAELDEVKEGKRFKKLPLKRRNNLLFFWGPVTTIYLNDYPVNWREW